MRMTIGSSFRSLAIIAVASLAQLSICAHRAAAQRVLGMDVSAHQVNISQTTWNNLHNSSNIQFAFIRSTRGGTTGEDHRQGGYPSGNNTFYDFSQRYDDPYFVQNVNQATAAGIFIGPYQRTRADILATTLNSDGVTTAGAANNGTDEANHYIQMAGAWMRPGYMAPTMDFEDGQSERTADQLAQFCLDFSNQIYSVMGIRPAMYINGTYTSTLQSASVSLRNQLAPAFPTLWNARYTTPVDVQNDNPKDTYSGFYGPWDDANHSNLPWDFWQYSSSGSLQGISPLDVDVSHGDLEYLKDLLVPAVWWNDTSGGWSTLANWNSGQTPVAPVQASGQLAPIGTQTLPAARLPGAAGSGPTSGQYDTVILDRPNANITVTLSSGTYNIRKLYMRETLNISGGSLTINYDPTYVSETVTYPNALRSGTLSAQFSGPVTLSGSGSLSVNTLQVDASQTFTLAGSSGTLTFKQINLLSAAKISVTGDVNINPLSNVTATISGSSGSVDLGGGTRIFNIGDGTSAVDLDIAVPITNGGLTKNGAGTMRLSGGNTFSGPVTVNAGVLRSNNSAGFSSSSVVTVNNGGTLDMNGISDTIASLGGTSGGIVTQGAASLTLAATSGSNTFAGSITGTGSFTKSGGATQILSGNNSLGAVSVSAGSLLFNGTNTTGAVTVASTATLGGTGSISGAITVNSGGHVAPGASIESLGMGALTLNAGSVLDIELAAPGVGDVLNVTGLLAINGGSVSLNNLGGLDAGSYTLITYGSRSGSVANLGSPTGGPSNFNFKLNDTGSAITLSVTIPGDFNLDNHVDAADYITWRKGAALPSDYNLWRANFGRAAGSGAPGLDGPASVPEPVTAIMALVGVLLFLIRSRPSRAG